MASALSATPAHVALARRVVDPCTAARRRDGRGNYANGGCVAGAAGRRGAGPSAVSARSRRESFATWIVRGLAAMAVDAETVKTAVALLAAYKIVLPLLSGLYAHFLRPAKDLRKHGRPRGAIAAGVRDSAGRRRARTNRSRAHAPPTSPLDASSFGRGPIRGVDAASSASTAMGPLARLSTIPERRGAHARRPRVARAKGLRS